MKAKPFLRVSADSLGVVYAHVALYVTHHLTQNTAAFSNIISDEKERQKKYK
jgi:hypothetical protein